MKKPLRDVIAKMLVIMSCASVYSGLVAEGEKTQKSGNIVVMKDLLGECLTSQRLVDKMWGSQP